MASAGLKAVGETRLLGLLPIRSIYNASDAVGKFVGTLGNSRKASDSVLE
jgi:hypothetical protein